MYFNIILLFIWCSIRKSFDSCSKILLEGLGWLGVIDSQVFDLGEEAPDKVLSRIYVNLEKLKNDGDEFAKEIQERLRIIVSLVWNTFFYVMQYMLYNHS